MGSIQGLDCFGMDGPGCGTVEGTVAQHGHGPAELTLEDLERAALPVPEGPKSRISPWI